MKFGVHFQIACGLNQTPSQRYRESLEQAVYAESLGFESVWPVEQHFNSRVSVLPAPMLFLSAIASKTTRIKLGTAITILPLNHPIRIAEELATLDNISDGRVEFGFGRGSMPAHFGGFGVPLEESRERMLESLHIIESLISEDKCTITGKYFKLEGVSLSPKPVQAPFPTPIAAANSRETFELMGKLGYPVSAASHINPFFLLKDMIPVYRDAFHESGHSESKQCSVDLLCPVFVGRSSSEVESIMQESLNNLKQVALEQIAPALNDMSIPGLQEKVEYLKNMSFQQLNRDMAIFEDVDNCVERIGELQRMFNINRLICWFNPGGLVPHEEILRSMELFSKKVMPEFTSSHAA